MAHCDKERCKLEGLELVSFGMENIHRKNGWAEMEFLSSENHKMPSIMGLINFHPIYTPNSTLEYTQRVHYTVPQGPQVIRNVVTQCDSRSWKLVLILFFQRQIQHLFGGLGQTSSFITPNPFLKWLQLTELFIGARNQVMCMSHIFSYVSLQYCHQLPLLVCSGKWDYPENGAFNAKLLESRTSWDSWLPSIS